MQRQAPPESCRVSDTSSAKSAADMPDFTEHLCEVSKVVSPVMLRLALRCLNVVRWCPVISFTQLTASHRTASASVVGGAQPRRPVAIAGVGAVLCVHVRRFFCIPSKAAVCMPHVVVVRTATQRPSAVSRSTTTYLHLATGATLTVNSGCTRPTGDKLDAIENLDLQKRCGDGRDGISGLGDNRINVVLRARHRRLPFAPANGCGEHHGVLSQKTKHSLFGSQVLVQPDSPTQNGAPQSVDECSPRGLQKSVVSVGDPSEFGTDVKS